MKLFLIRVKELSEPMVLEKKICDKFLLFLKSTFFWYLLGHLQLHNALQHWLHLMALCIAKQLPSGWPLITPGSNMALLSDCTSGWPQLTLTRPLTPSMHYTLVWGPFYQFWWPHGIGKKFDLWLTLADLCMTFDPSNALHSGHGFFPY